MFGLKMMIVCVCAVGNVDVYDDDDYEIILKKLFE